MAVTVDNYSTFQQAYDYFNQHLFGGCLPDVLITLQRRSHAFGYFSPEKFEERDGSSKTHELALNPDTFESRSDTDICATLVHEMCHVWRQIQEDPPRRGYHDQMWSEKMQAVGLLPTDSGQKDGKRTGQHMTHLIMAGGNYEIAYRHLAATGFRLSWQSRRNDKQAKAKRLSKTKYHCKVCGQNAWGKPDLLIYCGRCYEDEIVVTMIPQKGESAWSKHRW